MSGDAEIRELGRTAGNGDLEAAERLLLALRRRDEEAPAEGPFVDMLGHAIKPGAVIVHPVGEGKLAVAKVLATRLSDAKYQGDKQKPRMTVVGVGKSWKVGGPELELKDKGTLHFPDRTVVVDPWTVPKKYMDLLDAVEPEPDGKRVGKAKIKGAGQ